MGSKTCAIGLALCLGITAILVLPGANAGPNRPLWAYLVYLDADNNLDVSAGAHHVPVVQDDFDELMSVGSTADVMTFVLADRWAGPANLFKVNRGSLEERTDFALDGKEANMGDAATLRSFVSYVSDAVHPTHILLVFWDHGSPEYVAYDDNADANGGNDILTHEEVIAALEGFHVDVIAADECLVAQVEVAYEYAARGLAVDYLVAAETYTGWRGFPYDWTLARLVGSPTMSSREAAVMLVEETDRLLREAPHMGEEVNAHAAINIGEVRGLASAVMDLTALLIPDMAAYHGIVSKARGAAQFSYGANALNLIDLGTFVERIGATAPSTAVQDAAGTVLSALATTVVALQATNTVEHQIHGLGVMFPDHSWETPDYYVSYAFMTDGWHAFLDAYWSAAGSY